MSGRKPKTTSLGCCAAARSSRSATLSRVSTIFPMLSSACTRQLAPASCKCGSNRAESTSSNQGRKTMVRQLTRLCVRYAERYIPDPYLYALILTFITVAAAWIWTPSGPLEIIDSWYNGLWDILAFALQMALILTTGVALAEAPLVKKGLQKLAEIPTHQAGAASTVFLAAAIGSWLNWGFGLVVGTLVGREIGKRLRDVDFGFLVAAA